VGCRESVPSISRLGVWIGDGEEAVREWLEQQAVANWDMLGMGIVSQPAEPQPS
jgi:hypothetical protein